MPKWENDECGHCEHAEANLDKLTCPNQKCKRAGCPTCMPDGAGEDCPTCKDRANKTTLGMITPPA